jgi:hypothetical protein
MIPSTQEAAYLLQNHPLVLYTLVLRRNLLPFLVLYSWSLHIVHLAVAYINRVQDRYPIRYSNIQWEPILKDLRMIHKAIKVSKNNYFF